MFKMFFTVLLSVLLENINYKNGNNEFFQATLPMKCSIRKENCYEPVAFRIFPREQYALYRSAMKTA